MWTFTIDIKDSVDFFSPNLHRSTSVDALWTQLNTSCFWEKFNFLGEFLFYFLYLPSFFMCPFHAISLVFFLFLISSPVKITKSVSSYISLLISKACCKSINGFGLFYICTYTFLRI
uniref:Uncharacterized protein n=1 Tax=Cacopsylla melanoneura TaxID=428564 RepID=A0A8D8W8T2_9HEMI